MRCLSVNEMPPALKLYAMERIKGGVSDVIADYDPDGGIVRWWRLDGAGGEHDQGCAKGRFLVPADLIPIAEVAWAVAPTDPAELVE